MSTDQEKPLDIIVVTDQEKPVEPVVATQEIVRDPVVKRDAVSHCCVRSWSLCLNSVEAICSGLSFCCIGLSNLAIGCNKCLEQLDCDGH